MIGFAQSLVFAAAVILVSVPALAQGVGIINILGDTEGSGGAATEGLQGSDEGTGVDSGHDASQVIVPEGGTGDEAAIESAWEALQSGDVRVLLDFEDAELRDVVSWVSALTQLNFMLQEPELAGRRITIIGPTPVTVEEALEAFWAALYMNGLTVVPRGSYLEIIPADEASRHPLPIYGP